MAALDGAGPAAAAVPETDFVEISRNAYVRRSRPEQNDDDLDTCQCPVCPDEDVKTAEPTCTDESCTYFASRTQCPIACRGLRRCHNQFFRNVRYTKAVERFDVGRPRRGGRGCQEGAGG